MRKKLTLVALWLMSINISIADQIVVTNTNDDGAGSLRQAIVDAATNDTILFSTGLIDQTINVLSALTVDKTVYIEGDIDSDGTPDVRIHGLEVFSVIDVTADDVMIKHLAIGKGSVGITINSENVVVEGCYIGTLDGVVQDSVGVAISSSGTFNEIRSNLIISYQQGIHLRTSGDSALVIDNIIGLPTGVVDSAGNRVSVDDIGVLMDSDGHEVIGNEVIGSNFSIYSRRRDNVGVRVLGNIMSFPEDVDENLRPSGGIISDSDGIFIGDGTEEGANYITGPTSQGIIIRTVGANISFATKIDRNYIGVDSNGRYVPGTFTGIRVNTGVMDTITNNVIVNMESAAIELQDAVESVHIFDNSIFNNGSAISIFSGANGGISSPSITALDLGLNLSGTAIPNAELQIYVDSLDQAQVLFDLVTADASGNWSIPLTLDTLNQVLANGMTNFTAIQDTLGTSSMLSSPLSIAIPGPTVSVLVDSTLFVKNLDMDSLRGSYDGFSDLEITVNIDGQDEIFAPGNAALTVGDTSWALSVAALNIVNQGQYTVEVNTTVNGLTELVSADIIYDIEFLRPAFDSSISAFENSSLIIDTLRFVEEVSGLSESSFATENATISSLTTLDSITFALSVSPVDQGQVHVWLPADVAADQGKNTNVISDSLSFIFDDVDPVLDLDVVDFILGQAPKPSGSIVEDNLLSLEVSVDNVITDIVDINGSNWVVTDDLPVISINQELSVWVRAIDQAGNKDSIGSLLTVINPLESDSSYLVDIYNWLNGDLWANSENWLVEGVPVENWFGVTVRNNRVIELDLSNNLLTGDFPVLSSDNAFDSLITLKVNGNTIATLPDLTSLEALTDFDVSNNNLQFGDLEDNLGPVNYVYADQADLGQNEMRMVELNREVRLELTVDGDVDTYLWKRNGEAIEGADGPAYVISSLNRDTWGTYTCELFNNNLPDLVLTYVFGTFEPITPLSGVVTNDENETLAAIEVILLEIPDAGGAYDTAGMVETDENGMFSFGQVSALSNYTILAALENDLYVPTYFGNSITFSDAVEITPNEVLDDLDIQLVTRPEENLEGDISFSGVVFEEVPDVAARIQARRRVRLAGVSLYRQKTRLRSSEVDLDLWDLIAYTQTDDDGFFSFSDLPNDIYLIQIEFPGVPISEGSEVQFDLSDTNGEETDIALTAVIENDVIDITRDDVVTAVKENSNEISYLAYPNPAEAVIYMSALNGEFLKGEIELMDLKGRILSEKMFLSGGDKIKTINLNGLKSGVYFINYQTVESRQLIRFVKK